MRSRTRQTLNGLIVLLAVLDSGCGRDDTDRLARIGQKTAARCEAATAGLRNKVAAGVDAAKAILPEPTGPQTTEPATPKPAAPAPTPAPAASVASTPIDARVLWRIRWDKSLAGADIQVQSPSNGVVEVRGIVNDLTRQRRAIELAETTEGVEKVLSELGLKQP